MRNNRNEGNRGDHPFKNDKLIILVNNKTNQFIICKRR